jgi:arginyl-tRNA synthetase
MGDWGRNMALVVAGIINRYPNDWKKPDFHIPLKEINEYYVEASARAKEDPEFMKFIHMIKVELQNHHPEYFPLYEKFLAVSLEMMHGVMRKLNMLKIDNDKGERNAHQYIPDAEKWLREKSLLELSDGAEVIHIKRDDDTAPMPPYMFRDSRGATTYDSADIAAAYYRKITDNPDLGLYIVGTEQILHFEQLFRVLDKMEMFPYGTRIHMPIGMITGKDGKIFKTRNGGNVTLIDMIDMVDEAVRERVKSTNKNLDEETMHMIALSALKFNDFMHDLRSMYAFDPEEITAFEGRTGPYILYTAVRLNSALAKSDAAAGKITAIENDYERDLLLKILDFPRMIVTAFEKRAMDILANYTYDLAGLANVFYHHCSIKGDANRTAIARLTFKTLTTCIELMGLTVPQEM